MLARVIKALASLRLTVALLSETRSASRSTTVAFGSHTSTALATVLENRWSPTTSIVQFPGVSDAPPTNTCSRGFT